MSTVVWSKNNCSYCVSAKAMLDKRGIVYEERNIEGTKWNTADYMEANPGARSFPQVHIDGKHIGGFDRLQAHFTLGELTL